MPYAQLHYPFENKDLFERNFPADFIAEGLDQVNLAACGPGMLTHLKVTREDGRYYFVVLLTDDALYVRQTRGWFYTLAVLGAALFDKPAFKNLIVNGLVLASDGRKMSKRLKNYPGEIMDEIFHALLCN